MADQCEHTGTRGQCPHLKADGSRFCAQHSNESDRIKGYQFVNKDIQTRFEHHRSDIFASLGQEVAILRAMVETRLDQVSNPAEAITALQAVHKPLVDIVKCAEILSKLERQNNIVLGKEALNRFGDKIIDILIGELEGIPGHETIIDRIADQIGEALINARNEE